MHFFNKQDKYILVSIVLALAALLLTFYLQASRHKAARVDFLKVRIEEEALRLDERLKSAAGYVNAMKTQAEWYFLASGQKDQDALFTDQIKPLQGGRYYGFEELRAPLKKESTARLIGKGNFDDLAVEGKTEIRMALSLNPLFVSAKDNIPALSKAFYISPKGFIVTYPWVASSQTASLYRLLDTGAAKTAPPLKGALSWNTSPNEIDQTKGLISCSSAVHSQAGYTGTVGVSLQVSGPGGLLETSGAKDSPAEARRLLPATVYLLDGKNEIIAHSLPRTGQKNESEGEFATGGAFPDEAREYANTLLSGKKPLEPARAGSFLFMYRSLANAPFKLVYLVPASELPSLLHWKSLLLLLPLIAALAAIFVIIIRGTEQEYTAPLKNLIIHIERESSGEPFTQPKPPYRWVSSFAAVSKAFRQNFGLVRELEAKNRRLQHLDRLKDEFLLNVSSEFRPALKGIADICKTLKDGSGGNLTPVQNQNISMIVEHVQHLTRLVNNSLDFTKLRTRNMELALKPVELPLIADQVINGAKALLGQRPLALTNTIAAAFPPVRADEERLVQILASLIEHAVKHTGEGEIKISAVEEGNLARLSVLKTGADNDEQETEQLFRVFQDDYIDVKHGASGLVFTITKQLIELHGGTVRVENREDKGFVVSFTLPIEMKEAAEEIPSKPAVPFIGLDDIPMAGAVYIPVYGQAPEKESTERKSREEEEVSATEAPAETYPETPAEGAVPLATMPKRAVSMNILLADDDAITQKVLTSTIEKRGHRVTVVDNGKEALTILGKQSYDIILFDVKLPEIDGLRATRIIRNSNSVNLNPRIPIIALASHSMQDEKERCMKAGMDHYLSLPMKAKDLIAVMYKVIQKSSGENPALFVSDILEGTPDYDRETKHRTVTLAQDEIIDRMEALSWIDGNKALLEEILAAFLEKVSPLMERLGAAIKKNDTLAILEESHALKGAAMIIGAGLIKDGASKMITAVDNGEMNLVKMLYQMLEFEITRIVTSLKSTPSA